MAGAMSAPRAQAGDQQVAADFQRAVAPLLENYCYECHGDGSAKGKVAFDKLGDADLTAHADLWFNTLKNLRANIMPPASKPQPTPEEIEQIVAWIKYAALGVDPRDPDPGHATLRRLNRVEYGRTVRDLLGVDFQSEAEFPPDDTGHGFDNIGDVLSVSPLLLEKYLQAAETIVTGVVPQTARVVPVQMATGRDFRDFDPATKPDDESFVESEDTRAKRAAMGRPLLYHEPITVARIFTVERAATYRVALNLQLRGPFDFNPARCRLTIKVDGVPRHEEDLGSHDRKPLPLEFEETWTAGAHELSFELQPLAPAAYDPEAQLSVPNDRQKPELQIISVQVQGPFDDASRIEPANYRKFFPRGPVARAEQDGYAREILERFATRAFRRPVDAAVLTRLTQLARGVYAQPDATFEQGVSRAMMAVLASPRFLFRFDEPDPADAGARFPRVDEYSLASRLSYFLWSTMPDEELFSLAQRGQLRANLRPQVERMLRDPRSRALVRNFTGQWLQARDVLVVPINAREVLGLGPRRRGGPRADFDADTRNAMRNETELVFDHIMRGNRSVRELIESNYTFLNEQLAKVYGIPDITGKQMRLVTLPEDSVRGGVLTQGTTLTVTSNPTRTSPVKRGQFVLENILGTPAPPPPATVPALENAKVAFSDREPTLREMLAVHREDKLCSSCHARMDPLGLALENFNALGNWRDKEAGQAIEATGRLITGEKFKDVRELKHIIANERRLDFYRCLTDKLLTYALGRGLEPYDVETVDRIVGPLEQDSGQFSTLLLGVIESAPFQKQRPLPPAMLTAQTNPQSSPATIPSDPP